MSLRSGRTGKDQDAGVSPSPEFAGSAGGAPAPFSPRALVAAAFAFSSPDPPPSFPRPFAVREPRFAAPTVDQP